MARKKSLAQRRKDQKASMQRLRNAKLLNGSPSSIVSNSRGIDGNSLIGNGNSKGKGSKSKINVSTDIINDVSTSVLSIQGSFHQGDKRFGYNSGNQCTANSLISIIYSKVKDAIFWNKDDLDNILCTGDKLYTFLQNSFRMQERYISMLEIPKTLEVFDKTFELNKGESLVGTLDDDLLRVDLNIVMSLEKAIEKSLLEFNGCFITFGLNTFSVIHDTIRNKYFIFDSHSRNEIGLVCSDGRSVVVEVCSLAKVHDHCQNLAMSLNLSGSTQFEITGINVFVSHDTTERNRIEQLEIIDNDQMMVPKINLELDVALDEPSIDGTVVAMSGQENNESAAISVQIDNEVENIDDNLSSSNTSDVEIMSDQRSLDFMFMPLTCAIKADICCKFNIKNESLQEYYSNNIIGQPIEIKSIVGDGNCFFRAISYCISGSQNNHIKLRLATVKHIKQKEQLYTLYFVTGFQSIKEYLDNSKMKNVGTWATEIEIFGIADLLQTDIYVFKDTWLRFSCQQIDACTNKRSGAIYLIHSEQHYNVVLKVNNEIFIENSNSPSEFTQLQQTSCNAYYQSFTRKIKKQRKRKALLTFSKTKSIKKRKHDHEKYWSNEEYRTMQQESSRNRYQLNEIVRQKTKIINNAKYVVEENRMKQIAKLTRKYRLDEHYKDSLMLQSKKKYKEIPSHREHVKLASITKYKNLPAHREHAKLASIVKYKEIPSHRKRVKSASIVKYKEIPSHRECVKSASIVKYKEIPSHRECVKSASIVKYKEIPSHRECVKSASIVKYKEIPSHRERVKSASIVKYKEIPSHRESVKLESINKYKIDSHRKHVQDKSKNRYHSDKSLQLTFKERVKKSRKTKKGTLQNIDNVIERFKEEITKGPEYICCVCHRLLFHNQIIPCNPNIYKSKCSSVQRIATKCISKCYLHICDEKCLICSFPQSSKTLWICFTCHRKILSGNLPCEASVNDLEIHPIPTELKCLNSLESHLIALHIPFLKIMSLPRGGQYGVHGPVVSVPSNINHVTNILPRLENEDQMIRVKLKRKLSYKGHYKYQCTSKRHIQDALDYLKQNNIYYRDIEFNRDWTNIGQNQNVVDGESNIPTTDQKAETLQNITNIKHNSQSNTYSTSDLDDEVDERLNGMLQDSCLQPVDIGQEVLDQHFDDIICMAPAENNSPVRILMDKENEAKSFPVLFPTGSPTFNDNREKQITLSRYLHCRLMNADNRFACNSDYIFYAQYISELNQVLSNVSIALRKGTKGKKEVTAQMLLDKDKRKQILKHDEGYKFLKPIRGTPPFWQCAQKDLFAMLRQLGTPTWFCSFSCADLRWNEFIETILKQQGDSRKASELDWSQKCEVLRSNPVTTARMFDHRFHFFLKNVVMSPAQPIGEIVDYYYRVEFQSRGSGHTHCLFWLRNAPVVDEDDDKTVIDFIERYITCKLPSKDEDEEMHEIVSSVQTHSSRHSKTCKKKGTACRFNFPRPPSKKTFICRPVDIPSDDNEHSHGINNELTESKAKEYLENLWKALMNTETKFESVDDLYLEVGLTQDLFEKACSKLSKKSNLVLKRRPQDIWVNFYNSDLLKAWNANLDIQYVFDVYSCIVYIISYMSKSEKEMGVLLDAAQREAKEDNNTDAKDAMKKIGSVYLHNREVSAQEAVYRVCNLRLKEGSRKVQFIPTGNENVRLSLPLKVLQGKSKDTDLTKDIWMTSIVDRYKARPNEEEFDNMCLAHFCSLYRILSQTEAVKSNNVDNPAYTLQNNLGYIKKRTRTSPAVVRYARFSKTKSPELYFQSSLQLFLPYRVTEQLKPHSFEGYEVFYNTGCVKISGEMTYVKKIVEENRALFEKEAVSLDNAQECLENFGPLEDAWAQICPENESERLETLECRPKININEIEAIPDLAENKNKSLKYGNRTELHVTNISRSQVIPLLRSLNKQQSSIFYKIRQWCLDKVQGKNPKPFNIFLTASAGCGKSLVIKCIYYEATRILTSMLDNPGEVTVLICAPTGVAAFNVQAQTIHSAFCISTNVGLPYQPLGQDNINTLRSRLSTLEILIIDEISMVDHKLLTYIHGRLRQIKQTGDHSPFGNISILAVGDFYQLPPVKGRALYTDTDVVNLWQDNFQIAELTEIMRQQKDLRFAQTLNRCRTKHKSDNLSEDDVSLFQTCVTGEEPDVLHIFATNSQVNQHNIKILTEKCPDLVCIDALDYYKDARTGKLTEKNIPGKSVNSSLSKSLVIGVGARVMLTKNLDVEDGLVNGVFGTVVDIIKSTDKKSPISVYVKFDNERVGRNLRNKLTDASLKKNCIPIKIQEETVNKRGDLRRQFPLKLAYACTIHKVQGLTLEKAVVSLKKIFAPGQAYVALSRVTALDGLIIQDFNQKYIYCNENIESVLQQMPRISESQDENNETGSTIILHNVQGLKNHFEDIKNDKRFIQADYICLTETWINDSNQLRQFNIDQFHLYNNSRKTSYDDSNSIFSNLRHQEHGGVGIYKTISSTDTAD